MDFVLAALKSDYIASVRLGDGVFQVALDGSDRLVGVYLGRRFTALILLKAEGEAALAAVVAVFDDPARNGSRIGAFKHLFVQLIVRKPVEISPVCIAPVIFIKGVKDEFAMVIPIRIRLEAAISELLKKCLIPLAVIFSPARAADLAPLVADVDAVEYALPAEFIDKAHTVGEDRVHFHFLRGLFIDALEFLRKRGCIG